MYYRSIITLEELLKEARLLHFYGPDNNWDYKQMNNYIIRLNYVSMRSNPMINDHDMRSWLDVKVYRLRIIKLWL